MPCDRTKPRTQQMWLFPLAFIGLTIFGPALFADPVPCAEATLATYDVSGYQCTIDGFTLDDFTPMPN